ncbi:hypothetical protein AcV5_010024 [Taiwanofungus camphoratus]|nr:hypothetical protein AcV5_010024 [Antrodia cinnamomea]
MGSNQSYHLPDDELSEHVAGILVLIITDGEEHTGAIAEGGILLAEHTPQQYAYAAPWSLVSGLPHARVYSGRETNRAFRAPDPSSAPSLLPNVLASRLVLGSWGEGRNPSLVRPPGAICTFDPIVLGPEGPVNCFPRAAFPAGSTQQPSIAPYFRQALPLSSRSRFVLSRQDALRPVSLANRRILLPIRLLALIALTLGTLESTVGPEFSTWVGLDWIGRKDGLTPTPTDPCQRHSCCIPGTWMHPRSCLALP